MKTGSLEDMIAEYFDIGTNECMAYMCTRDKSAFLLGTMSLDDFVEFDDDNCSDIADYLSKNNVVIQNHGHWIKIKHPRGNVYWSEKCSVCGEIVELKNYKYCPNCFSKMDESEDNTNA